MPLCGVHRTGGVLPIPIARGRCDRITSDNVQSNDDPALVVGLFASTVVYCTQGPRWRTVQVRLRPIGPGGAWSRWRWGTTSLRSQGFCRPGALLPDRARRNRARSVASGEAVSLCKFRSTGGLLSYVPEKHAAQGGRDRHALQSHRAWSDSSRLPVVSLVHRGSLFGVVSQPCCDCDVVAGVVPYVRSEGSVKAQVGVYEEHTELETTGTTECIDIMAVPWPRLSEF